MSFVKRLLFGWGLPKRWSDIRSFSIVVPIGRPDARLAENGIQKAIKVRNALIKLCRDRYLLDEIWQSVDRKRQAHHALTDEEAKYIAQADSNYLEMACDKMQIVIFYEGEFQLAPQESRHALYQLIERYPGCSLVSGNPGIGDRVVLQT
jgi:hypothetical protein